MNIPLKYEDVVAKLDAALGREASLREELSKLADDYCEKVDDILDLQQRLTVAEQRASGLEQLLQMFIDNSDDKDVVELSEHALKPAAEGEGS